MSVVKNKYVGIQLLRALLFIMIIAFHCGLWGTWIFWGGIEIFFVISAYFLTKKLMKRDHNPFLEIGRRALRLYPVYALVLLFSLVCIIFIRHIFDIKELALHLLFSQNINWMITRYQSSFVFFTGHTWTLSIEMYAFVVYVFGFKLCKGKTSRIIFNIITIIAAIAWRTVLTLTTGDALLTSLCPVAHFDAFALGSLLAIFEDSKRVSERTKNITLGAALALGIAMIVGCICVTSNISGVSFFEALKSYENSVNYFNNPFTSNLYIGFSLLGVGLLYFLKKINFNSRFITPFVLLGNISYSAYLIHFPVYRVICKLIDNIWLIFVVTLILTIISSFVVDGLIKLIQDAWAKRKAEKEKCNDTVV